MAISIIAHRGASFECRENTMAAFQRAIALQADWLELDLHLSKDGIPICHHDPQLHTMGRPLISELTAQELQQLDPAVPTLADLLQLERGTTGLMVELKRGSEAERLVAAALSLLKAAKGAILVGSLCFEMVGLLTKQWPREQLIAIIESETDVAAHLSHGTRWVALAHRLANSQRIAALKQEGRQVWVWTVDELDQGRQLQEWGADGIITNRPAQLSSLNQSHT